MEKNNFENITDTFQVDLEELEVKKKSFPSGKKRYSI